MKLKLDVVVPNVPNYFKVRSTNDELSVPISEISEKDLKAIGKEWTEALVRKAKSSRDRSTSIR